MKPLVDAQPAVPRPRQLDVRRDGVDELVRTPARVDEASARVAVVRYDVRLRSLCGRHVPRLEALQTAVHLLNGVGRREWSEGERWIEGGEGEGERGDKRAVPNVTQCAPKKGRGT